MTRLNVLTGLDVLVARQLQPLHGRRVALLCNQASIDRRYRHISDYFAEAHRTGKVHLRSVWGPQHGLWGHTQDNMIEWQSYRDPRLGAPVYSLYGEHRKPTPEMLDGVEVAAVDLQDVGSKYYTFIWTMALVMEACAESGVEVLVLDRPNPIDGVRMEGVLTEGAYRSFVGWQPLLIRHGMTIAEIALYLQKKFYPDCRVEVLKMEGWRREMLFPQTGLPWAPPSPNMPLPETALVYPGMCLLEGTNLSEGRGTTRPFEIFGAPWIDAWTFCRELAGFNLSGVVFRPLEFQPTFQKHAGKNCGGAFIHVADPGQFQPFRTALAILITAYKLYPGEFRWKEPPYEYEYEKLPIDILIGNSWLREMIEQGSDFREICRRIAEDEQAFAEQRRPFLIY